MQTVYLTAKQAMKLTTYETIMATTGGSSEANSK